MDKSSFNCFDFDFLVSLSIEFIIHTQIIRNRMLRDWKFSGFYELLISQGNP